MFYFFSAFSFKIKHQLMYSLYSFLCSFLLDCMVSMVLVGALYTMMCHIVRDVIAIRIYTIAYRGDQSFYLLLIHLSGLFQIDVLDWHSIFVFYGHRHLQFSLRF